LRFKRVDNLGAYSIPSETGLLIPSGYISYPLSSNDSDTLLAGQSLINARLCRHG